MGNKKLAGLTVLPYLEKFPNTSSLALARLIYADHSLLFNSVDSVRDTIRYYRGSMGERDRNNLADRRFVGTGMKLTMGEEPEYAPYELPAVNNRILYLADVHLPFHDLQSIRIALEDAKDKAVNTVILGGDILDMYALSVFDKVPNKSTFVHERELLWQLIDDVNQYLPKAKVFWIEGNHEYRFYRFMLHKCAEVFDVDTFTMQSVFETRAMGIEYVNRKRYIRAGNLNIMHGHEFGNSVSSPVNPARGFYLKAKDSAVFGHLHQSSEHSEADLRGNVKTCYSVGCMCYLHPEYRPLNKWNTGYALIEIHPGGGFMVKNKKIVEGKIQ